MHSVTGPQLLLVCAWRDTHLGTSVGYSTHRTSGTSHDASDIRLMPLTGSKTAFQHQIAAKTERVNGNMALHIGTFDRVP
jgi:hypothetical protein